MIKNIRHTGIIVDNMEKCVKFYRDILGMKVKEDFWEDGEFINSFQNLTDVKLHMVKLTTPDGSMIELLKDEGHPAASPENNRIYDPGIRHISLTVENAEDSWNILNKKGYRTFNKPILSPDKKAKVFFARDPENNILEMVEII